MHKIVLCKVASVDTPEEYIQFRTTCILKLIGKIIRTYWVTPKLIHLAPSKRRVRSSDTASVMKAN